MERSNSRSDISKPFRVPVLAFVFALLETVLPPPAVLLIGAAGVEDDVFVERAVAGGVGCIRDGAFFLSGGTATASPLSCFGAAKTVSGLSMVLPELEDGADWEGFEDFEERLELLREDLDLELRESSDSIASFVLSSQSR